MGLVLLLWYNHGNYVWITSTRGVIRVLAADGSNQGTFPAGHDQKALVHDGTSIWVANYKYNTVTRLRGTDGSNQGTFQVGHLPTGLAYDGTSIWVANDGDSTVNRIRPSDWPPPSDNS